MSRSVSTTVMLLLLFAATAMPSQLTFDTPVTYQVGYHPVALCAADMGTDGFLELCVGHGSSTACILVNNGDGTFSDRPYEFGTDVCGVADLVAADFEGSGYRTLAFGGMRYPGSRVSVRMGQGLTLHPNRCQITYDFPVPEENYALIQEMCAADLDADGDADLAGITHGPDTLWVFLNDGMGFFADPIGMEAGGWPGSICAADFDGANGNDLAIANRFPGYVSVLLNNGDGTFQSSVVPHEFYVVTDHVSADFDGDGAQDIALSGVDSVSVMLNDGDGTFTSTDHYLAAGAAVTSLSVADFDSDGDLDLAGTNGSTNTVLVMLNNGDGTFAAPQFFAAVDDAYPLVAADLNGDGYGDLAMLHSALNQVSVMMNLTGQVVLTSDISGSVTTGGEAMNGVTVTLYDEYSSVMAVTATDESGHYSFAELDPGIYMIEVLTPMGFETAQEKQTVEAVGGSYEINFDMAEVSVVSAQRTRGYWAHHVNAHLTGLGTTHESYEDMCNYLERIRTHFTLNLTYPVEVVPVAEAEEPVPCDPRLEALREVIAPRVTPNDNDVARAHLAALLLNIASFKLSQVADVSEDGASASQAVYYCNMLVTDGDSGNDLLAKEIAETINKGKMVAAGRIDLMTPEIIYKYGDDDLLPDDCSLAQNYPNPFNLSTQIEYSLPAQAHVSLKIYNIAGQVVTTLVDGDMPAGNHTAMWDGTNSYGGTIASGVYFYQLRTDQFTDAKKMLLVK